MLCFLGCFLCLAIWGLSLHTRVVIVKWALDLTLETQCLWTQERQYGTAALPVPWSVVPSYSDDGSVPGSKGGVDTHKLWKHVLPWSTEFAWLPNKLAEAFCLPALQLDPNRQYGTLAQCVPPHSPRSIITVDQIYFIGDSCSASELEVFINMPIERLRVGCGLQCTLPHVPLVPSSRALLFSAAVKLLKFAMGNDSCCTNNAAEEALLNAMYPLLCNPLPCLK